MEINTKVTPKPKPKPKPIPKISFHGFDVYGWGGGRIYAEIVEKITNGTIVEIGVYGGASLLRAAEIGIKNNNKVIGIDPWETTSMMNGMPIPVDKVKIIHRHMTHVRKNLERILDKLGYNHVTLICGFSQQVSTTFADNSIDLVYIDGDHSTEAVYNDMATWYPKLKTNGLLFGDDFGWATVKSAVVEFCAKNKISLQILKNKWLIEKK